MPRNRRREQNSSAGSTAISILSIMLFIGVGVTVVVLRAQRRAAWNEANFPSREHRGGEWEPHIGPQPPDTSRPDAFAPNFQPARPATPAFKPGVTETQPEGGIFASKEYREYRQDGAILIGFEVGLGAVPDTAVVTYLRPIWLTANGEQYGTAYGRTRHPISTVKARDGYAIGGVRMKGGGAIEGMCFTFMRRGEKHLIADDFYISDWYGEQTRKLPENDLRRGDGGFVIGIHGKRFEDKGGFEFDDSGCIGTIGLTLWVRE